ncbi:hypothetical protein M8J77_005265 [Diaphorina citri]|nr:hypothetical protein M8J77_005265 [Diaphorina citri]
MWNTSYVTPIHKKGDKNNVENYRPISKISAIPKLFEALVYNKLKPIVSPLISEHQHGFMSGKSTSTNLMSYTQFLIDCLEDGHQVDVILTDFSAAYDRLNIPLLCAKLHKIGMDDPLRSWFRSYLSDRTQIVRYDHVSSEPFNATSGCPQGGHLSGLLFNVYINDLILDIQNVSGWLFADDFKMARVVRGSDDRQHLQTALDGLVSWCGANGMVLNVDKCQVITFHRKKSPLFYDYVIHNTSLNRINQVKDLGVIFDCDLKFNSHYNALVNKAFKTLGFLYRNSREFESANTLKSLYCSLVRSSLEYCSVTWSPMYNVHIDALEKVQRVLLRMLAFKSNDLDNNTHIEDIMAHFNMQTLEHRRDSAQILFIVKLVLDKINCPAIMSKLKFKENPKNTRDVSVFDLYFYRTNIGINSPINKAMNLCNIICNAPFKIDIRQETVASLKTKLARINTLHH